MVLIAIALIAAACSEDTPTEPRSGGPAMTVMASCPPGDDLAAIGSIPPNERLRCFGATELSFRAWVAEIHGAVGCPGDVVPGDGWLLACDPSAPPLAPAPGAQVVLPAHLKPGTVSPDAFEVNTWVEVRGHFDDPAAASCGRIGPQGQRIADASAVMACRAEFVVTRAEPG